MKFLVKAQSTLASKAGENYVDSGVKILIAVVVGALLLGLLVALFQDKIMTGVEGKVDTIINKADGYMPADGE